ncbi:ROK family protein, partial [Patescibacteria group bacterium]|nr:ROK family protein [Patescibacteria group bacterium]
MFISIDVGGTNTRLAISKNLKDIKEYRIFSTQKNFNLGIKKITDNIKEMTLQSQIKAIVVGLPGVIDREKQKLLKSPNLKNWGSKPITKLLSKKFKCPV